jgi:hypothetical protein
MSIQVETTTTYRAVCDNCGCAGPAERSREAAIEAVTARSVANRTGISMADRWLPIVDAVDGFYCGFCKRSRPRRERS